MPLFEMSGDSLTQITGRTFTDLGMMERNNLQRAIRASIEAITPGIRTMVLAEEFGDWVGANRRIDLLCLDEDANLVVVELKREGAAHMELQALRYAAMISTMRFDQAVDAHRQYLRAIGSEGDAEKIIRDFLDLEEDEQAALSPKVRIVLAASDFHSELTTAVLWLNDQGLDIRCVQLSPHDLGERVLVDIQQVIPLPEAADYQIAVREKSQEQVAAAKTTKRDLTRYNLFIGDKAFTRLPKRRLIYEVVSELVRNRNIPIDQIRKATSWPAMFLEADGQLDPGALLAANPSVTDPRRYFVADGELFFENNKTYSMSNQWGNGTIEAVNELIALAPVGSTIDFEPTNKSSNSFANNKGE